MGGAYGYSDQSNVVLRTFTRTRYTLNADVLTNANSTDHEDGDNNTDHHQTSVWDIFGLVG